MKPHGDQLFQTTYQEFKFAGAEKRTLTSPRDGSKTHCKSKPIFSGRKKVHKTLGVLLIFHMLNIVVAITGVISVAILLVGIPLNLCWFILVVVVKIAMTPFELLETIPERLQCLKQLGHVMVWIGYLSLFVVSLFNIYTCVGPYVLLYAGGIGWVLFYLAVAFIRSVVENDVRLANFGSIAVPIERQFSDSLQPGDCAKLFKITQVTGITKFHPIFKMTYHMWVVIPYFAVFKVIINTLSAVTIFFALIQPVLAIFSGGDAPLFTNWVSCDENLTLYIIVIVIIMTAGVVGLVLAAALSVKLTSVFLERGRLTKTLTLFTSMKKQVQWILHRVELNSCSTYLF